jgi:hypothetical protein
MLFICTISAIHSNLVGRLLPNIEGVYFGSVQKIDPVGANFACYRMKQSCHITEDVSRCALWQRGEPQPCRHPVMPKRIELMLHYSTGAEYRSRDTILAACPRGKCSQGSAEVRAPAYACYMMTMRAYASGDVAELAADGNKSAMNPIRCTSPASADPKLSRYPLCAGRLPRGKKKNHLRSSRARACVAKIDSWRTSIVEPKYHHEKHFCLEKGRSYSSFRRHTGTYKLLSGCSGREAGLKCAYRMEEATADLVLTRLNGSTPALLSFERVFLTEYGKVGSTSFTTALILLHSYYCAHTLYSYTMKGGLHVVCVRGDCTLWHRQMLQQG